MSLDVDVDPRYGGGYPSLHEAKALNTQIVRMLSLPQNAAYATQLVSESISVLGVITGESYEDGNNWRNSNPYVLPACSALQIGNEPMMGHDASFPNGGPEQMVALWQRVRNYVRYELGYNNLPLIGPGIWMQRPDLWQSVRNDLEEVVAAGVHIYAGGGEHLDEAYTEYHLSRYAAVAPDLACWNTEWTARWPDTLPVRRVINRHCDVCIWAHYGHGVPGHGLVNTVEYQLLSVAR